MRSRPRWLIRAVRRMKADEAFDIDESIAGSVLLGVGCRRASMAGRGVMLALRSGRFAFPVFVGRGVVVTNPRHLRLSPGVTIGDYCRLDCLGRSGIVVGNGVTLRRGVHIEVTSVIRELGEGCVLGERVGISEGCFLGAKGRIDIGEDTIIGPKTLLVAENHVFADIGRPIRSQGVTRQGITVGRDCWIGGAVSLLDGVRVGDGCVVGAGSVVSRDIPPRSVAFGSPARVVRSRG